MINMSVRVKVHRFFALVFTLISWHLVHADASTSPAAFCESIGGIVQEAGAKPFCDVRHDVKMEKFDGVIATYTFNFNHSDIVFDCSGNRFAPVLEGSAGVHIATTKKLGIVKNILVRNCQFEGFKRGLGVSTGIGHADAVQITQNIEHHRLRERSPSNIRVEDSSFIKSESHGVFIGYGVVGFELIGSLIAESETDGVYLEFASQHNKLLNNEIKDNHRFGIAIDSSAHNEISGNFVHGNGITGISLYKNCQEFHSDASKAWLRIQGSRWNKIDRNMIGNEEIALWLGSRQSRDLSSWDCGDDNSDYMTQLSDEQRHGKNVYYDYATNNKVRWNIFMSNRYGVIVEDDENEIKENAFIENYDSVVVGTYYRSLLGTPVTGVELYKNIYDQSVAERRVRITHDSQVYSNDILTPNTIDFVSITSQLSDDHCLTVVEAEDDQVKLEKRPCEHMSGTGILNYGQTVGLRYVQEERFQILSRQHSKCGQKNKQGNGARVRFVDCDANDMMQLFTLNEEKITDVDEGMCLDFTHADNQALHFWQCHGGSNQMVKLRRAHRERTYQCDGSSLCYK